MTVRGWGVGTVWGKKSVMSENLSCVIRTCAVSLFDRPMHGFIHGRVLDLKRSV